MEQSALLQRAGHVSLGAEPGPPRARPTASRERPEPDHRSDHGFEEGPTCTLPVADPRRGGCRHPELSRDHLRRMKRVVEPECERPWGTDGDHSDGGRAFDQANRQRRPTKVDQDAKT
jgi:hypothetical protein